MIVYLIGLHSRPFLNIKDQRSRTKKELRHTFIIVLTYYKLLINFHWKIDRLNEVLAMPTQFSLNERHKVTHFMKY